jgi:hypothetical protein
MTVFWDVVPCSLVVKFINVSEVFAASTPEMFVYFY